MIEIDIDVHDIFERLDRAQAIDMLVPPMTGGVQVIAEDLRTEPPVPAGTRYRRTHRLSRGWGERVSTSGNSIIGEVDNPTPYGGWVQSAQMQVAWNWHWPTDQQVVDRRLPEVLQELEASVQEALGR